MTGTDFTGAMLRLRMRWRLWHAQHVAIGAACLVPTITVAWVMWQGATADEAVTLTSITAAILYVFFRLILACAPSQPPDPAEPRTRLESFQVPVAILTAGGCLALLFALSLVATAAIAPVVGLGHLAGASVAMALWALAGVVVAVILIVAYVLLLIAWMRRRQILAEVLAIFASTERYLQDDVHTQIQNRLGHSGMR